MSHVTCVTKSMDEAAGRWAVVSGVSSCPQHKQVRSVLPFIPRSHSRQPAFCIFTVWWAGGAGEKRELTDQTYWYDMIREQRSVTLSNMMVHESIPVKYAEVESESKASNHTVVGFSCGEVVNVIPRQFFSGHTRAVLTFLVLNVLV